MRANKEDFRSLHVAGGGSYWEKQGSLAPFSRAFMVRNTGVPSLHHLIDRSGLLAGDKNVDDVLQSEEWDAFVREETPFEGWHEFYEAAAEDATTRSMLRAV